MTKTHNGRPSICHKNNPCAGVYGDCLDVVLTNECNAKCSFCVQRNNKHYIPKGTAYHIEDIIMDHPAKNILLVGGEPTLYHRLGDLLPKISKTKKVYLTTNGSLLNITSSLSRNLQLLSGLNISIHSPSEKDNNKIFGIKDVKCPNGVEFQSIRDTVKFLKSKNPSMNIRINANLFKGGIDSPEKAQEMIDLARYLGVKSIRFAELQGVSKEDGFIFASDIFPYEFLKDNPFTSGCETVMTVDNFPVTIRRVCGIVSKNLPPVKNPIGRNARTQVLHSDGVITDGFTGLPDCHKNKKEISLKKKCCFCGKSDGDIKILKTGTPVHEQCMENAALGSLSKKIGYKNPIKPDLNLFLVETDTDGDGCHGSSGGCHGSR